MIREKGAAQNDGPLVLAPNEQRSFAFDHDDLRQAMVDYIARKLRIHVASIGSAKVSLFQSGHHLLRVRGATRGSSE